MADKYIVMDDHHIKKLQKEVERLGHEKDSYIAMLIDITDELDIESGDEAVDEIKRLYAEVERLNKLLKLSTVLETHREVERLRSIINDVAHWIGGDLDLHSRLQDVQLYIKY